MKVKKTNSLLYVLAILLISRFSCTFLSVIPIFTIKFVFLYGVSFCGLYMFIYKKLHKNDFILLAVALAYDVYVTMITFFSGWEFFNKYSFNGYVLTMMLVIYFFIKHNNVNKNISLLKFASAGFIITIVYSIFVLAKDPMASRALAAGSASTAEVSYVGLGGFDTVYGTVLIIAILIGIVSDINNKKFKRLIYLLIIVDSVFIVMASYMTAIFLTLCTCIFYLFYKNKGYAVLLSVVSIVFFNIKEYIGMWFMRICEKITYSELLSEKIFQIGYILKTGKATGTLEGNEGRIALLHKSWDVFISHPIFGGMIYGDTQVGGHSEVFDILGLFGIVGLVLIVTFWILFFKNVLKFASTKNMKRCVIVVAMIYLLMSILNPSLFTQQMMPLIIIMPLVFKVIHRL